MPPHVVIIGGGFGGLAAAKALARAPVRVTLVDRSNHHLFQPLLYQVATAGLAAPDIAAPIRRVLRGQRNCTVLMAEVEAIDVEAREVRGAGLSLRYDHLIVAAGAVNNYFGNDDWAAVAPGLKTLDDALYIRRRILCAFEQAEVTTDPVERAELLTFVIIGAGPTGVELAGSIREIALLTLAQDFKNFDARHTRVVLIEGADRVLPPFAPESSEAAAVQLRELGVELLLNTKVSAISAEGVTLGDRVLRARTVLWGAGVKGAPVGATLSGPINRRGQVEVCDDLSLPGHPEVFVVGDLAHLLQEDGQPVPGVAQGAIQGGQHAAAMIQASLSEAPRRPFRYVDKGSMATIGRRRAVAEAGGIKTSGVLAWLLWLAIHILFLIDFRNRVMVLLEWAWSYVSYRRSARVILTGPPPDAPEKTSS